VAPAGARASEESSGKSEAIDLGDVATWVSSLFTALVFFHALHAWREERRRNRELEAKLLADKALDEANKVACWVERSSIPLRKRIGVEETFLPDGTWTLVVENDAPFTLFSWSAEAVLENPSLTVSIDNIERGPIGPNGGILVLPIVAVPRGANPRVSVLLKFSDGNADWIRDVKGLRKT
jgi:hypothetical protein